MTPVMEGVCPTGAKFLDAQLCLINKDQQRSTFSRIGIIPVRERFDLNGTNLRSQYEYLSTSGGNHDSSIRPSHSSESPRMLRPTERSIGGHADDWPTTN